MHISFNCGEIDYSHEIYQVLLLADRERVDKYRQAIEKIVKPGDVVADLGCGSGCLGRLAIEAGAAKVVMIDKEPTMLEMAKSLNQILMPNEDIEYRLEDGRESKCNSDFDVVVSEIIGCLGDDEGMSEILWKFSNNNLSSDTICCPQYIQVFGSLCQWLPECQIAYFSDPSDGLFRGYYLEFNPKTVQLFGEEKEIFTIPGRGYPKTEYQWNQSCDSIANNVNAYAVWFKAFLTEDVILQSGPQSKMSSWGTAIIPIDSDLLKNKQLYFSLSSQSGLCELRAS